MWAKFEENMDSIYYFHTTTRGMIIKRYILAELWNWEKK